MTIKTKDKPAKAADALRPYVKRAMEDQELRDDLLAAFVAARSLYGQVSNRHGVKGKADKIVSGENGDGFEEYGDTLGSDAGNGSSSA
jgi:hypothetical protein